MALGCQVVDLVGLDLLEDADQVGGIGEVPVVENEIAVLLVGVLVEVVDAVGVEGGCPAFDAVDFIAFFQQEFGEVGAVLAGDAGDQCFFHGDSGVGSGLRYCRYWGGLSIRVSDTFRLRDIAPLLRLQGHTCIPMRGGSVGVYSFHRLL
jgi:hypothetical protein